MTKRINADSLRAYDSREWTLIPLHRPDDKSKKHGRVRKDGKRPLDFNWTTREYDSKAVLKRCLEDNRNVGVRLKPGQLVIDVDPRNGGTGGFSNLCADLAIDESEFPCVKTGSGGFHYYMSKPEHLLIVDTLEDYPGVEFKSKGRQVVASGSIHPETGDFYAWQKPLDGELPPAPRKLLNFIKRPERKSEVTGGGQYSQEAIARALEALDVTDFRDHDKWLRLMMAVHHASNGDARHEWIEWCTQDPNYADQSEIIGRRWDSLHKDKNDGVTYRTLNKILADNGAANKQAAADFGDDFDAIEDDTPQDDAWLEGGSSEDDSWLEGEQDDGVEKENSGGYSDEAISKLEKVNAKYFLAVEGSKLKVFNKQFDPMLSRHSWARMNRRDFEDKFCNVRLGQDKKASGKSRGAADTVPLGRAWFEWAKRREYETVLFDPTGDERPGVFNLWDGFAVEPHRDGSWSHLRDLIHEVLANGDDKVDAYILDWLAFMIQKPEERAEVALVFRGGMGVGKGTLGNVVAHIIGRHALAIASPELITGRFNSHLQDVVFLFADEAIKPYDKHAESRLKAFITEPLLAFEGKGRDAVVGRNYVHIMMASNESWVIPAGMDERRFLVSDANNKWQGKTEKWEKLWEQLRNGGFRRLMHDLLKRDIEGFHPRKFPVTAALVDQKIRSMSPLRQFIFGILTAGASPFETRKGDWTKESARVFSEDFRNQFALWCKENQINPGSMGRSQARFLFQELRQILPTARFELLEPVEERTDLAHYHDGRAQAFELPPLEECRAEFTRQLGGNVDWPPVTSKDQNDFG